MDIHLVRVPKDVDVVNVRSPAKWGERPAFFSVHVDSYALAYFIGQTVYSKCNTWFAKTIDTVLQNHIL